MYAKHFASTLTRRPDIRLADRIFCVYTRISTYASDGKLEPFSERDLFIMRANVCSLRKFSADIYHPNLTYNGTAHTEAFVLFFMFVRFAFVGHL